MSQDRIPFSLRKARNMKSENLVLPLRVEWKPNKSSEKSSCFGPMKNQLSTIKNDVEKLIQKNNENRPQVEVAQALEKLNKKYMNSQRSRDSENIVPAQKQKIQMLKKEVYGKNKQVQEKQVVVQQMKKEIKIQKTIITELKKQNRRNAQEINLKDNAIYQLKSQLALLANRDEKASENRNKQVQDLKLHNQYLQANIEELEAQLTLITTKFKEEQSELVSELKEKVQRMEKAFGEKQKVFKIKVNQLEKTIIQKQSQKIKNHSLQMQKLSLEFSQKMNKIYEQNYHLKNKINKLQSQRSCLEFQKKMAIQNSQKFQAKSQENQELLDKVKALKQEKKFLISQYQERIMKLESDSRRKSEAANSTVDFNILLKEQLNQNQLLKQKIREKCEKITELQEQIKQGLVKRQMLENDLQIEKIKVSKMQEKQRTKSNVFEESLRSDLLILQNKYESICSVLESKKKQIKMKDEFIQSSLVSKINKFQSAQEVQRLIQQLKFIIQ